MHEVFLNNKLITEVIDYDTKGGWVKVKKTTNEGHTVIGRSGPKTEIIYGDVRENAIVEEEGINIEADKEIEEPEPEEAESRIRQFSRSRSVRNNRKNRK